MRKYYVMASFQNESFPIHSLIEYPEVEFKDLTYIDLYTIHKTKEEFFEEIKDMNPTLKNHQLEELDFFIARTTYNQKDKKHRIRFYDCIFKSNDLENKTETKILMNLEKLALERSKNVAEKKTIELKETTNFLEFASYLIQRVCSESQIKAFITREESIVDKEIKNNLKQYMYTTDTFRYNKIIKSLRSYKNLRGVCLEYLNYLKPPAISLKEETENRKTYLYPSEIFGFTYSFQIFLDQVNVYPLDYVPPLTKNELEVLKKEMIMDYIRYRSLENQNLERYYNEGGLESVMENMSADELYGMLSDEDKVATGLMNIDEYMSKHQKEIEAYFKKNEHRMK